MEKLSETEIEKIVEDVLTSPCNMIKLLLKYEKRATYQIDHGCLHLDFDDRVNSPWNDDIIRMLPLEFPVTATSWKGVIYVHSLDGDPIDCDGMGTHEILEMIMANFADVAEAKKRLKTE